MVQLSRASSTPFSNTISVTELIKTHEDFCARLNRLHNRINYYNARSAASNKIRNKPVAPTLTLQHLLPDENERVIGTETSASLLSRMLLSWELRLGEQEQAVRHEEQVFIAHLEYAKDMQTYLLHLVRTVLLEVGAKSGRQGCAIECIERRLTCHIGYHLLDLKQSMALLGIKLARQTMLTEYFDTVPCREEDNQDNESDTESSDGEDNDEEEGPLERASKVALRIVQTPMCSGTGSVPMAQTQVRITSFLDPSR